MEKSSPFNQNVMWGGEVWRTLSEFYSPPADLLHAYVVFFLSVFSLSLPHLKLRRVLKVFSPEPRTYEVQLLDEVFKQQQRQRRPYLISASVLPLARDGEQELACIAHTHVLWWWDALPAS